MAFQEAETKILHDLGILNSNIQSPKRQHLRPDVESPQTSVQKHDRDELTQRLIDDETNLRGNQTDTQSNTFCKQLILYGFAIITINAVWILLADICHIADQLNVDNIFQLSWIPASFGGGIFVGTYFVLPLLLKFYALFTIQFFVSLAVGVAILQYNFLQFSTLLFAMSFLGIALGVVERSSYLYIYRVLNGSKRKVLFLYAVLAFGLVFTNCAIWLSAEMMKNNFTNEILHRRVKHDAGLPALNLSISQPAVLAYTEGFRPTKPSSAIGISEDQDTKTAENAEKRKLAEQKKENATILSNTDCAINPSAEACKNVSTTISSSTATSSTTTSTTTTTTSTTLPPLTTPILEIPPPTKQSLFEGFSSIKNAVGNPSESLPIERGRNRVPNTNLKNNDTKITTTTIIPSPPPKNSTKTSSAYTVFVSFLVIVFLAAFNFVGFACNYFWFKDTLFTLFWTVGNYKTPSTVTRIASAILWVLSDFILYGLFSLAPFIYSNLFDIKHSSYPLIYGIYIWGSVFLLRSLLFAVPDFAISKKCLRILLFTSLCSIILYFTSTDNDLRFTCLISTGVSISSITILTALHQQEAMCLSPYTTSDRYMFWSSIGRFFGPLIMGKILADYSIQMLVNLIFICLILMIVAFYYFSANITSVARHQQLQDLKMDISAPEVGNAQASASTETTSSVRTKSTRSGNKYSLIEGDSDDLSNCLISDSEDELLHN